MWAERASVAAFFCCRTCSETGVNLYSRSERIAIVPSRPRSSMASFRLLDSKESHGAHQGPSQRYCRSHLLHTKRFFAARLDTNPLPLSRFAFPSISVPGAQAKCPGLHDSHPVDVARLQGEGYRCSRKATMVGFATTIVGQVVFDAARVTESTRVWNQGRLN